MDQKNSREAFVLQDSGERRELDLTGAHRDRSVGKGRYDLLPAYSMRELAAFRRMAGTNEHLTGIGLMDAAVGSIYDYMHDERMPSTIVSAMSYVADLVHEDAYRDDKAGVPVLRSDLTKGFGYYSESWETLRRLAIIFEKGAIKYDGRNWEKGMPLSWFIDSALRHLYQWREGKRDEDHAAQALFNLVALCYTEYKVRTGQLPAELDDLPPVDSPVTPAIIPYGDGNPLPTGSVTISTGESP